MKIDNYLFKYKDKMDSDIPDTDKMWGHISQGVKKNKPKFKISYLNIAASFLLLATLITVTSLLTPNLFQRHSKLSFCNKPVIEKEQEYIKRLEKMRVDVLTHLPDQEIPIISFLENEYLYYENEYEELIKQLNPNNCDNSSIQIIYKTYERRIAILKDMNHESQKYKSHASNNP